MHECSLGNAPLVNAEVDSMGGVVENRVGFGIRLSSRRAAIEKAQADLRREFDAREERKRELEFLEKGGNPLDFTFGNAASVSVQSTSLIDQPSEPLVTSEAKGSFASTASLQEDSVESSGRPEAPVVSEPNCADNLLLFDGKNDSVDGGRNSIRFVRSKIAPSEHKSQLNSSQNAKESGESAVFGLPNSRAYKRRNRSRPNRGGARSSSADLVSSRGDHVSSLPSCSGQKDMNHAGLDTDNKQNQNISRNHNPKPTISNGNDLPLDDVVDIILDNGHVAESITGPTEVGLPKLVLDCEKSLVHKQRLECVAEQSSAVASEIPESVDQRQLVVSPRLNLTPVSAKPDLQTGSVQHNGFLEAKGDEGRVQNEGQSCSVTATRISLDSESYFTKTSLILDRTTFRVPSNGLRNEDINENTGEEILICPVSPSLESDEKLKTKNENKADDRYSAAQDEQSSVCKIHLNDFSLRPEAGRRESGFGSQEGEKHTISIKGMEVDDITASEIERKPGNLTIAELDHANENVCSGRLGVSVDKSTHDNPSTEKENAYSSRQNPSVPGLLQQTVLLSRDSSDINKHEILTEAQLKLEVRTHEDSILIEARVIEAKRKRIAQLSVGAFISGNHQRSHWDFVLEEMAWLANDFAQERHWKISATAQLSHQIVSTCRERLAEKSSLWKQKKVAHTLSKAIMEFWLSAEELSKGKATQYPKRISVRGVQEYAVRYLKCNASLDPLCLVEAPVTLERISDLWSPELSWEEQLTEENLFYTVPSGAMETYRKAIQSHLAQVEKTCSRFQEEVETSIYDAAAGNAFEEDEGETNTYLSPGDVESRKPSKSAQKKRNLIISSSTRSYDMGTDLPFMQRMENKFGSQQSGLIMKRPANNVHVSSIPTKRMRTASRLRFTAPFTAGTSAGIQLPNKADASSGDTNSFQDDQSLHRGSKNMEVESLADFGRQIPFDPSEVSKPKRKKKPNHLGSSYEQRWQLENNFQNELGGYPRKRFDKLAESNGSRGLFGQHITKKQKMLRQTVDNSHDNYTPLVGSIPSPVTSQMSNMSNSNKLVKILGGHRGKKSKSLKLSVGQRGPGTPWSSFEEQALIVLVHDLGPNWELISDAINNILQYKCIFRNPKDCSEHHKELISRTAGDGADSGEDSGSSQPYPPTLPGIPKGSARALFQRLQEPIEEDMIKFHFEKIILMSQKLHCIKMQNENQEQKPIQPHSSHAIALSQVCPNNVNGGVMLTPLDLCDATASSTDVLSNGYQGTHGAGLGIPNHASAASLHSTSGANSSLQGSPNLTYGNNFPWPSTPVNSSIRDGRYGGIRSTSLPVGEHQKVQQYNQMMPGRVSGTPLGTDSGGRRNVTMARPGFPGIPSLSVLNSGGMLSPNMAPIAGPANMHSVVGAGPGNLMLRPRESLNMMRPAQMLDHQKQMMVPDLQMPATQGNIQGAPPIRGPSGGFSKQTPSSSSQTHPFHHHSSLQQSHGHNNPRHPHLRGPNHVSSPQHHQSYAKERQLQLQQQRIQQKLASSSGMMSRGPSQSQASPQNSSDAPLQTSAAESEPLTPSSSSMPPCHSIS